MSPETIVIIIVVGVILLAIITGANKKLPKKLNQDYFVKKWRELQNNCATKQTWPLAIIEADKLLDEALKRRRFNGKTVGERMTSAQRLFTNNDALWFAHKLRNKLVHEQNVKLREKDVKEALVGFRQALRDLGAL